jgi:hypothetical protein
MAFFKGFDHCVLAFRPPLLVGWTHAGVLKGSAVRKKTSMGMMKTLMKLQEMGSKN